MEGWKDCREIHADITALIEFTNDIQKHIKKEGLSKETALDCKQIHEEANLTGSGYRIGEQVMEMIEEMGKDLSEGKRLIATSDVLESLNGKWKTLIEGSRTPALGSNALLMPALMGNNRADEVKRALEAVKVEDVEKWTKETIGITFHQEKSGRADAKLPENPKELIPCF